MSWKHFALAGEGKPHAMGFEPASALANAVWMDSAVVEGCMFAQGSWIKTDCTKEGLVKHESDALLMFCGSEWETREELHAEVELQIENDVLHLTETCFVYVPAGKAYGNIRVKNLQKPVLYYCTHKTASDYAEQPAEATEPAGKYADYHVEKYLRDDGVVPEAPEGFLDFLLWIDGQKLPNAPYMETVWFKTTNDTGPAGHFHDFDEIVGFIGSDPDDPQDLGATIQFVLDDRIITTQKCALFCVPRGVCHAPIIVPELHRKLFHFSGSNAETYVRT
jgi:hypothetical protein